MDLNIMIRTLSSSAEAVSSLQAFCASMSQKYHQLMRAGGGDIGHHRMMEPEDDREILRYAKSGMSRTWIAAKMGIHHGTVRNRLKRMGYEG